MSYINMKDEWKLFFGWLVIVILLLLSGCASVTPQAKEKWSAESITLYTTLQGFSMIDAKQTFMMNEYRSYYENLEPISYAHEGNPLIGESPTKDRVVTVKLLSGALTLYLLNNMKEKNRKNALIGFNILYLLIVIHNNSLGLNINL